MEKARSHTLQVRDSSSASEGGGDLAVVKAAGSPLFMPVSSAKSAKADTMLANSGASQRKEKKNRASLTPEALIAVAAAAVVAAVAVQVRLSQVHKGVGRCQQVAGRVRARQVADVAVPSTGSWGGGDHQGLPLVLFLVGPQLIVLTPVDVVALKKKR